MMDELDSIVNMLRSSDEEAVKLGEELMKTNKFIKKYKHKNYTRYHIPDRFNYFINRKNI